MKSLILAFIFMKGSEISLARIALKETKQKVLCHVNRVWSEMPLILLEK